MTMKKTVKSEKMYPKKVKPFAQILVTGLSKKKGVVKAYLNNN